MGGSTLAPCSGGRRLVQYKRAKRGVIQGPTARASLRSKDNAWETPTEMSTYCITLWKISFPKEANTKQIRKASSLSCDFYGNNNRSHFYLYWVPTMCQASSQGFSPEPQNQTMTWMTAFSTLPRMVDHLYHSRHTDENLIHHTQ